jgi:hypothetical protein
VADLNERGSLFLYEIVEDMCTVLKLKEGEQDGAAHSNLMILSNQDIHFKTPV